MLLEFKEQGLYCPVADVYIDPWKSVKRALITHGHSDHARWGHQHYLCTTTAAPVIRYRLGDISLSTVDYLEPVTINGVRFSFHPAGHILGSAQIRVAYRGEVWVVSGDYKIEDDDLAEAFEPVPCHTFITESTFGLPIYQWEPQEQIMRDINDWWRKNKADGKVSVLFSYALGKAQRLLQGLDPGIGTIYTHGAVENTNEIMRQQGIVLPPTTRVSAEIDRKAYPGNMVVTVPSTLGGSWLKKFKPVSLAYVSGWMRLRGARRRRAVDRGFVLSDHADWTGLNEAIKATGAERVFVTHGYTEVFSKWLREQGLDSAVVQTAYGTEEEESSTESE